MTVILTFDEAKADIEAIIAEKGADFVYKAPGDYTNPSSCAYFQTRGEPTEDTPPGCIIGHLLARHGITGQDIGPSANTNTGVGRLVGLHILELDQRTIDFLSKLQSRQDCGDAWGVALEKALAQDEVDMRDGLVL